MFLRLLWSAHTMLLWRHTYRFTNSCPMCIVKIISPNLLSSLWQLQPSGSQNFTFQLNVGAQTWFKWMRPNRQSSILYIQKWVSMRRLLIKIRQKPSWACPIGHKTLSSWWVQGPALPMLGRSVSKGAWGGGEVEEENLVGSLREKQIK